MSAALSTATPEYGYYSRYCAAVNAIGDAMTALELHASVPVPTTRTEQLALVGSLQFELKDLADALGKFSEAGAHVPASELESSRKAIQARLHPQLLQSPFARRCFEKPLGYAGDYVMVRYILEDPFQGDSAFAQMLNFVLVQADVAAGHRNRITFLEALLERYATKAAQDGRQSVGLTIGCGPAEETARFIQSSAQAARLDLTLMDFNDETLDWTEARLNQLCAGREDVPKLTYLQESVYELIKARPASIAPIRDFVICAGLFDYLNDRACSRVIAYGLRSLRPGGTLLVTNVSQCRTSFEMSQLLEWDLIYRSAAELEALVVSASAAVGPGFTYKVYVDETGTNVLAEITRSA